MHSFDASNKYNIHKIPIERSDMDTFKTSFRDLKNTTKIHLLIFKELILKKFKNSLLKSIIIRYMNLNIDNFLL